jgi:DNA repair exonuclease SbcCD ATPase subunit
MLERDKALKLELDVVNSLHSDMTLRLAMSQRTIKQLTEKVTALEAAEATARQQHEAQLHEKAEAIIQLEARIGSMSKKSRSENSKMVSAVGEEGCRKCGTAGLTEGFVLLLLSHRTTCGASWRSPSPCCGARWARRRTLRGRGRRARGQPPRRPQRSVAPGPATS